MSRRLITSALAVTVLSVIASGCNREAAAPTREPESTTTTAALSDDQLATYVQARYQAEHAIAANDIDVSAQDGVVTLRGTVSSDAERQQAVTVAQQVNGVRSVNDQMRVEPRPEAGVAATAPARREESGTTAARAGWQDQNDRSPAWITTKIQAQYFADSDVKPWNVDVTTRSDGSVVLRGDVDDARAREAAERIARSTEGVTRVDNQLRIATDAARTGDVSDRARAGDARPADADRNDGDLDHPDPWLTAKVQAKFFMDRDVKGRRINVDTRDGVVTLTGEVDSAAERRQAVALANNTEGVRSVEDRLQVRATEATNAAASGDRDRRTAARSEGQPVEDAWITTIVQSKFFLDRDIKGRDINVDTRNGVVTLKGTVESDEERQAAQAIATETSGVSRVVNNLTVTARERR